MSAFVVSNDRSDGTPNVPDANANGKWRTKLWRRNREAGHGTGTSIYVWDDALSTSDPTLLKWVPVGTFIGESTLSSLQSGSTRLSITPSGGNVYFDVVESNLVLGNISGNLPGSKLPSNVALTDAANTFTLHTQFPSGLTGTLTGNADTATTWAASRTVTLTGDATGSASGLDGSADLTINTTVTHQAVGSASPYWNASHFMSRVLTNDVPTDGQAYIYEASTGKWKPGFPTVSLTGRTTDELIEGSTNLYYTDARFDARLGTKNTDDLSEGATNLYFTDSRARSSLTSSSNTNGTVLQSYDNSNGTFATVDLDNRYLQSFTETDPTVPSHVKSITSTNISNWNTAYGWGDHGQAGYLTSFTETDPTVPAHVKSITSTEKSNWNTAYGWGNHSGLYHAAGGSSTTDFVVRDLTVHGTTLTKDTQQVNIGDNIMVLNAEEAGTPTDNAGIEVERGTSTNTSLRWDESTDRWQFTNDGTNYKNLAVDTDDLAEGSSNLYYTDTRFDTRLGTKDTSDLAEGTNLYWTDSRFDTRLGTKSTDDLSEGSTNLYHTSTRVDARISAASIGDLSDVSLSGLSSGQVLQYNSTSGNFEPATVSSGGGGGSGTVNSGTSGKLAYYSSTGTTLDDAAELHFDSTNSRLGIGTTSPDTLVEVVGSDPVITIRDTETSHASASSTLRLAESGASGVLGRYFDVTKSGESFKIIDDNGGSPATRLTIDTSGNLGLGTTPSFLVHANETDTTTAQVDVIAASCNGSTVATLGYTTSGGAYDSAMVRAANNKDLVFVTNNLGLERMRITDSGNVKIGDAVTDFTSKLTVSGNGSTDTGLFMYDGAAGTYLAIETGAANGVVNLKADARSGAYPPLTFETGGSESARIDSSGTLTSTSTSADAVFLKSSHANNTNAYINNSNATTGNTANLYFSPANDVAGVKIGAIATDDFSTSANRSADLALSTRNNGSWAEGIRIAADGSVGISEANPDEKLHVNSGSVNTVALFESTDTEAAIQLKDLTGTATLKCRNDFRFYNNSGELARIDSSGNVGIKSTNPSGVLEVNTGSGIAYFTRTAGDDGSTNPALGIAADSTKCVVRGYGGIQIETAATGGSSAPRLNILETGEVGVGTAAPGDLLHLSSSSPVIRGHDTGGGSAKINFGSGNITLDADYGGAQSSSIINFKVDGTERMRLDSSGLVGIGSSSPSSYYGNANDLVVARNDHAGITIKTGTSDTGWLVFADGTASGDNTRGAVSYDHSDNSMKFRVNNDAKVFIDSGGSVGIGATPSSSYKLLVDGDICASGGRLHVTGSSSTASGQSIYAPASHTMAFSANSVERMRITAGGAIGVGTSSPNTNVKLEVAGPIRSSSTSRIEADVLNNGANSANIIHRSGTNTLVGNGNYLYVTDAGNVGVGTSSPSANLHIVDSTDPVIKIQNTSANPSNGGTIHFIESTSTDGFSIHHDGNENELRFQYVSSGAETAIMTLQRDAANVGIGTTAPSEKLHVNGHAIINNTLSGSGAYLKFNTLSTGGYINWQINGSEKMRITDDGTLDLKSEKLKLNGSSGSDGQVLTTDGSGGVSWEDGSGNTTGNGLYEHAHTISSNYTITTNNNAISAGPVSVASGVSVTVPSGSTWVVA